MEVLFYRLSSYSIAILVIAVSTYYTVRTKDWLGIGFVVFSVLGLIGFEVNFFLHHLVDADVLDIDRFAKWAHRLGHLNMMIGLFRAIFFVVFMLRVTKRLKSSSPLY